jgi:hypothetical protein
VPVGSEGCIKIPEQLTCCGFGSRSLDAKEIVDLADEDDEGDTRCEAADDCRGDEGNEPAKTQETDDEQQGAREQARDPDTLEAITRPQHDEHSGHCARWPADLIRRARKQSHAEAGKDRGDESRCSRGA